MAKQKSAAAPEPERCRITLKTPPGLKTALKNLIKSSSLDPAAYEKIECDGLVSIAIYVTPKAGYKGPQVGNLCNAINTKKEKKAASSAPVRMGSFDDLQDKPAIKDPPPPKDPLLP